MSLNVGDSAPDFLLKTGFTEEDAIVLNDYKDKTLVLAFSLLHSQGAEQLRWLLLRNWKKIL